MNKIIATLVCGALALVLFGCQQNGVLDNTQEPYLELSEEIITLSQESSDKEIRVETNAKTWSAKLSADVDWLRINRSPDAFILSSEANETGQERTAKITVEADGRSVDVLVRQRTSALEISLSQTHVDVPVRGGSYVINVSGVNSNWRVDGSELFPWVLVQQAQNGISLQVLPNHGKNVRVAKVYVTTASATPVELVITQQAKSPYVLPYMPQGAIYQADVLRDAQERGMFFTRMENVSGGFTIYHFDAGDEKKSTVQYRFKSGIERYLSLAVTTIGSNYGLSSEFETYLSDLGFELSGEKIVNQIITKHYVRVTPFYLVIAQVQVPVAGGQTIVTYKIEEVQPHPMKTFDKMPYRNIDLLNTADFFAVKEWEESEGECIEIIRDRGEKNPNVIYRAEFSSVTNRNTHVSTLYFFEETTEPYVGKLFQKVDIYRDIHLALWANSEGRYFVTSEMEEMLRKEGFAYQGRPRTGGTQEWISYLNIDERLAILFTNVNQPNGEVFLGISLFKISEDDGTSATAFEAALKNAHKVVR